MAPVLIRSALGVVCLVLAGAMPVHADTVVLKDRTQLKGVVVEEHPDRYLLSTAEGERFVRKEDVEAIRYDDPEQSRYQLGRQFQRAGRLREALKAYQQALAIQPDFQAAKDAIFQTERLLWQQQEAQLRAEIQQKQLIVTHGSPSSAVETAALLRPFDQRFGCTLGYEGGWTVIASVQADSPAAQAGLKPRDLIVAVWGEPIRHLDPLAISEQLRAGGRELQLTIERAIILRPTPQAKPPTGLTLALGYDGLRVASVTPQGPAEGLLPGDLFVAIGEHPTRYLGLRNAMRLLTASPQTVVFVQRQIHLQERPQS